MTPLQERKKASRLLKQAQKVFLTPGSPECQNILDDIHNAEVDLNYTIYHPLDEKYHSLYPPMIGNATKVDGRISTEILKVGKASRPAMWAVVEECMKAGTLISLRDGELGRKLPEAEANASVSITRGRGGHRTLQGKGASSNTGQALMDEENDSDGGFFEVV